MCPAHRLLRCAALAIGLLLAGVLPSYGDAAALDGPLSEIAAPVLPVGVTVTAPNGGEVWSAGATSVVRWTSSGVAGPYRVDLHKDGQFFDHLGRVTSASSNGSLSWTICDEYPASAAYTIRVTCDGCRPPAEDFSNGPFEISSTGVPTLALSYPNGGEVLLAGSTQGITWDTTGPKGDVAIWLLKSGQQDLFLGRVPMETGESRWDVDALVGDGTDYRVRLSWLTSCGPVLVEDLSDAPFSIAGSSPLPTLTVTSPNGGEAWPADTTQLITWTSTNTYGDVEIWLTDAFSTNGTRFDYLGSATMASGQFSWAVPPCVGNGSDLAILLHWSAGGRSVDDLSDAPFEVSGSFRPVLSVTSPLSGASWVAGTTHPVTWTCSSTNGEVEVELFRGMYQPYLTLGRFPVSQDGFLWSICPSTGNETIWRIRVFHRECGAEAFSGSLQTTGSLTPTLTVTSPVGGETWAAGTTHEVTWTSSNLSGLVDVYVPDDVRHHWGRVTVPVSDGRYVWSIAPTLAPRADYGVRLVAYDCVRTVSANGYAFSITAGSGPSGDLDGDGDVDLIDLARFQAAFTGRGPWPLGPARAFFDVEPDGDVDRDDYSAVWDFLAGPTGD